MLDAFFSAPLHYKVAEPWMWETPASSQEEQLVERAVDKRKREFRAGRHAAHALFTHLRIQHPHLLRGMQREPDWPAGWVGSISHTPDICVVVLASSQQLLSVGLDVEQASPLNPELREMICRPEELEQIQRLRVEYGTAPAYEKLIFSAKEAVHKTYFPLNHHTLDFCDARIELDWPHGIFTAHILNPEPGPKTPISRLDGKFLFFQNWIFTTIMLPKPE